MQKKSYAKLNTTLIHNLKKKIEELKESEGKLQAIINNSPAVIFVKDLEGKYLLINSLYERLFHISKNKIIGKTDYDVFPKKIADAFRSADLAVLKANKPLEAEEIVPQDDGMHYYISLKFPLYDANNRVYAVCGIATDITERKKIEQELKDSEKKFKDIFKKLADGVAIVDIKTKKFIDVNNQFYRYTGYSKKELLKKSILDIHPKKELPYVLNEFKLQSQGRKTLAENIPILKKDKNIVYVDINSVPILINKKPHLIGIFRDVTERKKAEQKLIQQRERYEKQIKAMKLKISKIYKELKKLKKKHSK